MSAPDLRARQHVLGIVALSLFAALFTRLWYLQVLETDEATAAVDSARTQTVVTEAPRGRILDRSGKVLVENRRTIQVQIDYQDFIDLDAPEQSELLGRLARELNRDAILIAACERVADDAGPRPDEPEETTTSDPDDEAGEPDTEGQTTTTTTTTTVPTVPVDPEDASALDEPDPTDAEPEDPCAQERFPAGVATGVTDPDGTEPADEEETEQVTEEILRERIDDPEHSKFKPVPIETGISEELEIYLKENPERFPTVSVERVTVREYRYGALLAHVLGYVGTMDDEDEAQFQNDEKPYAPGDEVGKDGIERELELELRGVPGQKVYEVDASNRPIREIVEERRDPVPGRDVYLTIDINLQYLMEKGLAAEVERRRGEVDNGCPEDGGCNPLGAASVAIDPRDGQVLAIASYPTYDPNLFVGGISEADYEAIAGEDRGDEHNYPLLNRATAGQYAPGSTFKLFSAYAGLENGLITPDYVYDDTGVYKYSADCDTSVENNNCSAQNAGAVANGSVDLQEALTLSSDTYFYKIGDDSWRARERIGETAMQDAMEEWGLGEQTGIDLPGEATGRIPTPDWLMDFSIDLNGDTEAGRQAGTWTAGESGNTMVGQGSVLVTPLQLAQGYATLANGGTIWEPQLVLQVTDYAADTGVEVLEPEATGQVDLRPEWRDSMIAGFDGVTKADGGTATTGFEGFDQSQCPVAGKTGTAQVNDKNDSSLFAAFAPTPTEGRESVIAMATVFQEAGFGAAAAVPLTRRVLEPFASVGCDITEFGKPGSAFEAPLGGYFDVNDAQAEYIPPSASEEVTSN